MKAKIFRNINMSDLIKTYNEYIENITTELVVIIPYTVENEDNKCNYIVMSKNLNGSYNFVSRNNRSKIQNDISKDVLSCGNYKFEIVYIYYEYKNKSSIFTAHEKKYTQKAYNKNTGFIELLKTMPPYKPLIFTGDFTDGFYQLHDAKVLLKIDIINFYDKYLQYIIEIVGIPIVVGRVDEKPILSREYTFDQKCWIIQAAFDRLATNRRMTIITLDLTKIVEYS